MDNYLPQSFMTDQMSGLMDTLGTVMGALFILIIGLILAKMIAGIVRKVLKTIKVDDAVLRFSFFRQAQESGWKVRPSVIFSQIVKWLIILMTLIAVADKLSLESISGLLAQIVTFIPQLIVAVILITLGFVAGQFIHDIIAQSMRSTNAAHVLQVYVPIVAKFAIIAFAVMAAATQVGIAEELISTFFATFLQALALSLGLAIGLSFGLGGKEHASRFLDKFTNR